MNTSPREEQVAPRHKPAVDDAVARKLSAVMRSISMGGSLRDALTEIVAAARSMTRADRIRFVVYSEEIADEMRAAHSGASDDVALATGSDCDSLEEDSLVTDRSHFSRPKDWAPSSRSSDSPIGWRDDDWLRIPLEGKPGSQVACLEVLGTSDGSLLNASEVSRLELLADLAAVAIASRKELMRQEQLSDSMRERTDLLEDLLTISSSIVSERSPGTLSDKVLSSLSTLFGFQRVSLVVFDDDVGEFRWQGLFGYPEEAVRFARSRTIPADLVLEELTPANKLSRSAYFIQFEGMSERSRKHFVMDDTVLRATTRTQREEDEMSEGDSIAFVLRDSTGRTAGAIYASMPRDGKKPDSETIETIEIFTSLAEVAIEDARLSAERETALRVSSQRTEQLSRIFDLTSELMYVRNLDHLLDDVLRTLAQLLGIKRATIGVRNEAGGTFVVKAVLGYPKENVEGIKKVEYSIERVEYMLDPETTRRANSPIRWRKKIGRRTYYVPAESVEREPEDAIYYPESDLISHPRKSKAHWHALDYMDTFIFDREDVVIAYIEILQPRDDRIPDAETIEVIEIFASLVGIAIENARRYESQVEDRRSAEFYTDLLSHDIKNFNQAIMAYLDLVKEHLPEPSEMAIVDKIADQVINVSRLANDVRTMSRLTWGSVSLSRVDLGAILVECFNNVRMYHMKRTIEVNHSLEPGRFYVRADELLRELFTNLLTNAVKYDTSEPLVIDAKVERKPEGDHKWLLISIADHGCGVPDELKEAIFHRFSMARERHGSSGLGLHIVTMLARRYRGNAWVEDRVSGDHTQGSVFVVKLPEY